ncbi:MAG TPA: 4a-hydroxytetrahydrobiopterin dehydratase [Terracidiphilus sp.]|jgi:4a-hydroxytetrahydrobiopterin dehydratase
MSALSAQQAASLLNTLPNWQIEAGELVRTYKFDDFGAALGFVNRVGELAEAAGHHPDIDIRYNKVRLALVTHDTGGLTNNDFELAAQADKAV